MSTTEASRRDGGRGTTAAGALGVDLVAVVVFAIVGRGAHKETAGLSGVWQTAWPFLLALLVTWAVWWWAVPRGGSRGASALTSRAGAVVWAGTLVLGMIIRGLATGRVPHWSFLVVAAIALAIFFFGWRGVAALLAGNRGRSGRR